MKSWMPALVLLFALFKGAVSYAETIYNSQTRQSILDMATDPDLMDYERYTFSHFLCYKGDVQTAYEELIELKDLGLILSDTESDEYVSSEIVGDKIAVTVYSSKVEDEGEYPYFVIYIETCSF